MRARVVGIGREEDCDLSQKHGNVAQNASFHMNVGVRMIFRRCKFSASLKKAGKSAKSEYKGNIASTKALLAFVRT